MRKAKYKITKTNIYFDTYLWRVYEKKIYGWKYLTTECSLTDANDYVQNLVGSSWYYDKHGRLVNKG